MRTIILLLLLPCLGISQDVTSAAVSDSIKAALLIHVEDSILSHELVIINPLEAFYFTDNNLYTAIGYMPGGRLRAVTNVGNPIVFRAVASDCTRAWTVHEIDNWLDGNIGSSYVGYSTSGLGTITAELSIDEDIFSGTGTTEANAVGDAFYRFLISAEFLTLLIN